MAATGHDGSNQGRPAGSESPPESEAMAQQRHQAKQRRRRIIYNNDGCDVLLTAGADTPEGFLSNRLQPLLGTQVDSVSYCTGATTMFTHRAEVGETYGEFITDDSAADVRGGRDAIRALQAIGHDALELATTFCHEHDLEILFSHRINDIHDSFLDWELSRWKRDHPEYVMGSPEDWDRFPSSDPRHYWSSLDFALAEVREYLLAILADVCRRYDIDGIEIDYIRSPLFFRPNLEGLPVTAEQVAILSEFMGRVRALAYAAGNRRGRPILVAARTPPTVAICRHVGIDIEGWLAADLLDVLITGGGYVPFTVPTRELVERGHAHDLPVYPTISASGLRGRYGSLDALRDGGMAVEEARRGEQSAFGAVEAWRGAATTMWQAGADGIGTFNLFPAQPNHPVLTSIGEPQTLARRSKVFAIDNRPSQEGCQRQAIPQAQILPVDLDEPGEWVKVNLPIGDDLAAAAQEGSLRRADLGVQFGELSAAGQVDVSLNSHVLTAEDQPRQDGWFTYRPEPRWYRQGDNTVAFRVLHRSSEATDPVVVTVVEVLVECDGRGGKTSQRAELIQH